jgi:hypothetical protein
MQAATHVALSLKEVHMLYGWPLLPYTVAGMEASAGGGTRAASMPLWQVLWT